MNVFEGERVGFGEGEGKLSPARCPPQPTSVPLKTSVRGDDGTGDAEGRPLPLRPPALLNKKQAVHGRSLNNKTRRRTRNPDQRVFLGETEVPSNAVPAPPALGERFPTGIR